jgi:hypothetical protein
MFKKNGGGLKKQYIGGVEGNLGKVERTKRSNKGVKQILGGVVSNIKFDDIEIKSEAIMKDGAYQVETGGEELKKICRLALFGLGAAMTGELNPDSVVPANPDKDKIKILVSNTQQKFLEYLQKIPGNEDIEVANIVDRAKRLGFLDGLNVTRAYILNKILQCFEGDNPSCIAHWNDTLPDLAPPNKLHLTGKTQFINPVTGEFFNFINANENKVKEVVGRIHKICNVDDNDNIKKSATNLHTVLFVEEQIGTPAEEGGAPAGEGEGE